MNFVEFFSTLGVFSLTFRTVSNDFGWIAFNIFSNK